jgi:hypothetical protein
MVRNELGVRMKKESYVYVWQVILPSKVETRNKRIKKMK